MKNYAPFALRIGIGGLFVIFGILKLMNPSMVVGMLDNLGFPGASFWAWLLIIVELLGGACVLTGFQLKYATVPLMAVLFVAIVVNIGDQMSGALKDITLLSGLISLWLSGPGEMALSKR